MTFPSECRISRVTRFAGFGGAFALQTADLRTTPAIWRPLRRRLRHGRAMGPKYGHLGPGNQDQLQDEQSHSRETSRLSLYFHLRTLAAARTAYSATELQSRVSERYFFLQWISKTWEVVSTKVARAGFERSAQEHMRQFIRVRMVTAPGAVSRKLKPSKVWCTTVPLRK